MDSIVNISDEFDQKQGRWINYDTHDVNSRLDILRQRHVDIRSFASDEAWSAGVVDKQADRNHWSGISVDCPPGTYNISSVIVDAHSNVVPIDILTGFDDNDFLSVALPAFPLANVNLTQSSVQFTSDPAGSFGGFVSIVPFSSSTIPLVAGDSEWRVPRSALGSTVNPQAITGVRFHLTVTAQCTFRALAIRLLGKDWLYSQSDIDTRLEIYKPTVSPDGSITRSYDFNFPAIYRASNPPGVNDPKPIDVSLGVVFNSGTKTSTNSFSLYFRETTGDFTTMLDLDNTEMGALDGNIQPDLTDISYKSRTQDELDFYTQDQLSGNTQFQLERTIDSTLLSFLQARLDWTASSTTARLIDSTGNGYIFSDIPTLIANTMYIFIVDVEDTQMRARLYPVDGSGNIDPTHELLNTAFITDPFTFTRRSGRIGWSTQFADGDVFIERIRTRSQTFASLLTSPYESITPVAGAELHVIGSEPLDYFVDLFPSEEVNSNIAITRDSDRQVSGSSYRVNNPGTITQGVQTNLADFNDFEQVEITFELYFPSDALGEPLTASLTNDKGIVIPLQLPQILPDRWQKFYLNVSNTEAQTGRYRLSLTQTGTTPTVWWIDNIHITERVLSFYGRSELEDPWHDANIDWVPFKNRLNSSANAIQFLERGKHLQIMAKAHHQSARIDSLHVTPIYAQLGRFVWDEDELYLPQSPTADFTYSISDLRTVSFDARGSFDPDGEIINYEWNFGNGASAQGVLATYTYPNFGVFTATVIVTDRQGLQDRKSIDISIENV